MNISFDLNKEQIKLIKNLFCDDEVKNNSNQYVDSIYKVNGITITIYKKNKKGLYPTVFGGKDNDVEELIEELDLDEIKLINNKKKSPVIQDEKTFIPKNFVFINDQIGSDEVGTGDFFGPITVVAALVKKSDLPRLKELGVTDSKKLTDAKIRSIGKVVIKEFKYSSLVVDNNKFNELTKKEFNMNKIKCYLHNRALLNLKKKYPTIRNYCVDQFESRDAYYEHLKNEKEVLKGIIFHTKGESYFPSVALASVIARYSFLLKMDELNKKYKTNIPFGGASHVDAYAINFAKKYGIKELDKIVKKSFKNYQRVIDKVK